ncbi:DUF5074 domain-containing protein [Gelidibacter sp.]|uniref:DUF5074 domain-containing protein n=1 Tax=Gelidibacter sp. TaxID=2018083 RepID=UPI002C5D5A8B|nr:DUF5074 domain-containing protein [Gelidibacter sp.]HUH26819.1 DUF5074 domain-containing protein [Gelidibacter sp.]
MKILNNLVLALSLLVLSFSCSSDDDNHQQEFLSHYEKGILITHEGNFSGGFGTVSYVSNDLSTVENNIFSNVNGRTLGAVAQSMAFNGDLAYIIINGSNQIEVVNRYTFESVATIDSGLSNPRYMTISNGKGYVTNWGDFTPSDDDYVAVIDLNLNKVISTISTSYLPEELVAKDNKVYVATGIFGNGNKVDVINSMTDQLELSITVGNSPNSLQFDSNGNLWVLSSENLIKIDRSTNTVLQTINFVEEIASPSYLSFDSGNFYMYASGSVYKMNESSTTFPTTPEFSNTNFYGMNVRNGSLYGVDAGNFSSNGSLKVYDLSSNTETKSITLSLIPGGIYFND